MLNNKKQAYACFFCAVVPELLKQSQVEKCIFCSLFVYNMDNSCKNAFFMLQ